MKNPHLQAGYLSSRDGLFSLTFLSPLHQERTVMLVCGAIWTGEIKINSWVVRAHPGETMFKMKKEYVHVFLSEHSSIYEDA